MLIVCWFLPLTILSALVIFFTDTKLNEQLENTIVTSMDKAVEICQMRVDAIVEDSKAASYLPTIRDSYERYQKIKNSNRLTQEVTSFLSQHYRYNSDINMTALYFTEEPEKVYYCYNNSNTGGTYASVQAFKLYAREEIQSAAKELGTEIAFMNFNDRIYLIRNMMDSHFEPYAVIIIDLNVESILTGLDSVWGFENGDIFVDGKSMLGFFEEDPCMEEISDRIMKKSLFEDSLNNAYVYKRIERNRHIFSYMVLLDSSAIIDEMGALKYAFYLLTAFMIPLILMVFNFFHRRVNMPISVLREAYKEIEKENYGYQIEGKDEDEEFYDLESAFNSMSSTLKYQFEKNYLEELALRDANIMALQSQINPHFLNNTLEIINWEARMADNYKVSGMIEALSTMLEATMNRKHEALISLTEEMSYVDAYLYIIAQRFGEKLEIEKSIDESLMRTKVPRLIIQPIIENAVEHGMDIRRKGKISITIRREGDKLLIEVMDNGRLTEEAREKIDRLLKEDNTSDNSSLSLGIRNVNKRLKIIYGEEYGLVVKSNNDNFTVVTIMVKIDKEEAQ